MFDLKKNVGLYGVNWFQGPQMRKPLPFSARWIAPRMLQGEACRAVLSPAAF